jgi:hypothetical protein
MDLSHDPVNNVLVCGHTAIHVRGAVPCVKTFSIFFDYAARNVN